MILESPPLSQPLYRQLLDLLESRESKKCQKLTYSPPIYPFHIDAIGHVNNIVYIQWMEIGRVLLLEAIAMPIEETIKSGFGPALVETHISYKMPLYLGDKVLASIWLSQLRGASAILEFEFFNQNKDCSATGSQRGRLYRSQKQAAQATEQRAKKRDFLKYLVPESTT